MDLKKFYEMEAGELDTGEEKPAPLHGVAAAQGKPGPARRKELLEQQLVHVQKQSDDLSNLMERAKLKEGEAPDTPGRLEALGELIQQFYKLTRNVKVKLKDALMDPNDPTKELEKFAMKTLSSDKETGDAQKAILESYMKIAEKFFPNIKMDEIETADKPPKRVVVVLGLEAEEFNAIVMAEKSRVQYEASMAQINKDIIEANAAIETDRMIRRSQESSKTPMADKATSEKNEPELTLH